MAGIEIPQSTQASFSEYSRSSPFDDRDQDNSLGQLHRVINGAFKALLNARLDHQPIHHDFDRMILLFLEADFIVQTLQDAVDASADKAILRKVFEQFSNSPFRPRTIGASTMTRSPSGRPSEVFQDLPGDWLAINRPHCGQCGIPIEE